MAGVETLLDVEWFGQEELYFCGPAVAQMFLGYFKVAVSQDDLWTDVTNNTGGNRPASAPSTGHDFPQQVCHNCEVNTTRPPDWVCWDTTPEALQRVVNARTSTVSLAVQYPSTFDQGVEMLIESLDRAPAVPPFATTTLLNHWVLVNGYMRDDFTATEAPAVQVGKYYLNGIYILDPLQLDAAQRVRLVAVRDWRAQFGSIACASDPNVNKHPIVVGGGLKLAAWAHPWRFAVITLILILLWFWWISR